MKPRLYSICLLTLALVLAASAGKPASKKGGKFSPVNDLNHQPALGGLKKGVATQPAYSEALSGIGRRLSEFMARVGVTPGIRSDVESPSSMAGAHQKLRLPNFESLPQGAKKVIWDEEFGTPRLLEVAEGPLARTSASLSEGEAILRAQNFLKERKSLLQIADPEAEFSLMSARRDEHGITHVRFRQVYNGVEVWAKDLYVHVDARGNILSLNGRYAPTPVAVHDVMGKISASQAIEAAVKSVTSGRTGGVMAELPPEIKRIHGYDGPIARRVIWHDALHQPHLVWFVEVRPNLDEDWYYFVDAISGSILDSYNAICYDGATTGSGTDLNGVNRTFGTYQIGSTYYMIDASQPMFNPGQSQMPQNPVGGIVALDLRNQDLSSQSSIYFVTSGNNQWTDPASVSAHFNAIQTYTYYRTFHNRNSVDDKGMTLYSIIHVTRNGQPMENAFWSGKVMCYGDGGVYFKPLAGGLDVAAHEMTHGVTQYTANLEYRDQSGALNESISDVFGAMVDSANWTMGEQIIKDYSSFPTGALRDFVDPHNGGTPGSQSWQPAKMSEFVNTTQDNGGVHINSGIPNHAFYLVARDLGRPKAARIWYRALSNYLTRSSQFIDARIATVKAATDLYGATAPEVQSVKNAWDAVEVYDGSGTPPPPTTKPQGTEWILVTNTDPNDPNSLYMAKTTIQSTSDYFPLSRTIVFNRPAVSDNGQIVVFVDGDYNLRALYTNPQNPQETLLDTSGVWWSVALGPGLSSLALTRKFVDTTIYYFDLVHQQAKIFKIVTQSFDAPDARTALYADALSFDPSGQFLLFDAFNEIRGSIGDTIRFWNINLLNIATGQMGSVFPPLGGDLSIGNPAFSKTSPTRFTFDFWSRSLNVDYVLAADFNTGKVGTVAGPLMVLGYPTYSADDRTIAYHTLVNYQSANHDAIQKMPLQADMITGTGSAETHSIDAAFPVWFVIGTRVGVDEPAPNVPQRVMLYQNYPNPFNPTTTIRYSIPSFGLVTLKVYNVLGQEVRTLVNEQLPPGNYQVQFDALDLVSGVYFYRLQVGKYSEVMRMLVVK